MISECSLSGRDQGHVSNFHIVDLENFATASRRYTGDIHNSTVVGLFMTPETLFMTHCLRLNLQLHTIGLVSTCRMSSFCTRVGQETTYGMGGFYPRIERGLCGGNTSVGMPKYARGRYCQRCRVVKVWNCLPPSTVIFFSLTTFRNSLNKMSFRIYTKY